MDYQISQSFNCLSEYINRWQSYFLKPNTLHSLHILIYYSWILLLYDQCSVAFDQQIYMVILVNQIQSLDQLSAIIMVSWVLNVVYTFVTPRRSNRWWSYWTWISWNVSTIDHNTKPYTGSLAAQSRYKPHQSSMPWFATKQSSIKRALNGWLQRYWFHLDGEKDIALLNVQDLLYSFRFGFIEIVNLELNLQFKVLIRSS